MTDLPFLVPKPGEQGARFLACSTSTLLALEEKDLHVTCPWRIIDSHRVQAELEENWSRLGVLGEAIDGFFPGTGDAAAYYLKVLLDTTMEKTIHLDEALTQLRPAEVRWVEPTDDFFDERMLFAENYALYSRLAPQVLSMKHPEVRGSQIEAAADDRSGLPPRKVPIENAIRRLRELARRVRWRGKAAVMIVEPGYGLERAIRRAGLASTRCGLRPGGVEERHMRAGEEAWAAVSRSQAVRRVFDCRGVDLFPVVESRLRRFFVTTLPSVAAAKDDAIRELRSKEVRLVASSFFSSPRTHAVALAARDLGIPVLTLQHSAYGFWHWPLAKYTDSVMADFKLVGGLGAANYVRSFEAGSCTPVATGMLALDHLLGAGAPRRGIGVVYPLASYARNFIHYTNSRLTLTEYFDLNRRILKVLGTQQRHPVRVIPHPAPAFRDAAAAIERWIRSQGWTHVEVIWSADTFREMQSAEFVVIDSPSTVFVHAAMTRAEIALYNAIFPMTEEGLRAIRKRARYSEDLDEFCALLGDALATGPEPETEPDDEFLRLYATHLHDGRSTERAAAAIRQIVEGRLRPQRLETDLREMR